MTTCKVREFDALDSASVAEVLVAAFAPLRTIYTPKPEAVDRQEQHVDTLRIIAEMSGRIVGTVEVDRHRHNLHLVGLAVHPDYQRLGVGRAMIEWIESHLTSRAIELAAIRETGNIAAFERMGFSVVSEKVADWCVSHRFERLHEVAMAKIVG